MRISCHHRLVGLSSFNAHSDGVNPRANIIQGSDGNFYGTTSFGGASDKGILFKLTPGGVETVLYSFLGSTTDSEGSFGPLIHCADGYFYGTSRSGGASGQGTVFKF